MRIARHSVGNHMTDGPVAGGGLRIVRRVGWMDGLRGVAAMQVMLLHYVTAFLPAIGVFQPRLMHYGWEIWFIQTPLFYLFDGYSAVNIFFVLSGVALTYSFAANPSALAAGIRRRLVRLGVPMIVSILLAALFWRLLPSQHTIAAHITGSEDWLGRITPGTFSIADVIHQAVLEGMLAGYRGSSMLPSPWQLALGLRTTLDAFNPPLWTLHTEFYGSLLILCLVAIRHVSGTKTHGILCVLVGISFSKSFIALFLVGHVAAFWLPSSTHSPRFRYGGVIVCLLGLLLCSMQTNPILNEAIALLYRVLPAPLIGPAVLLSQCQSSIGAVLVFIGVAMTPACRRGLELSFFRWLGKISFSLYLTHFAFLFTVVCAIFNMMSQHYSFATSMGISSLLGFCASFGIAVLFEKFVDGPAILLSRMVGSPKGPADRSSLNQVA